MAIRDEDFGADLSLVEGDEGICSFPEVAPACAPREWRSEYEREHARAERERTRADAAEAGCEELRWAEVASRTDAGSWKSRFKACRSKLTAAEEATKELRRAAKDMPALQAEVARLKALLSEEGIEWKEDAATEALRKETARLRRALAAEGREDAIGPRSAEARRLRAAENRAEERRDTIKALRAERGELRKEVTRLNKEVARRGKRIVELDKRLDQEKQRTESTRERAKKLSRESLRLHREVRWLDDAEARARSLSDQVFWLRLALDGAEARKDKLKARLVKLRATGATLSKLPSDEAAQLRNALRRSRRQKTAIKSLSRENARLHRAVKASRSRIETLEAQLARLRATGVVLSKALFGRKSEQQEKPRSGRKRGHQPGAPGHGRTHRPGLEEKTEEHNPPADACVCSRCGQPYAPNGAEDSTIVEIEVKAHTRRIVRPRWRRSCDCASSPIEVAAPPAPRLFDNTHYGISVWACFLFERYACFRPLNSVAAWLSDRGLAISPGTLADSVPRFVPLFEPVAQAILAYQNKAEVRHADETGWRVQALRETDRSSRAWLWTSVTTDAVYFHIDPSRSAEAAAKLFGETLLHGVIVCDRYSAYKRLARLLGGRVTLAWCWSHMRRDFIDCAAGQERLTEWCERWIERIAAIYRLNEARLAHYNPGVKRQSPLFDAAQEALKKALDGLFSDAERELAELPDKAREGKALRSLVNHRDGLSVFLDRPSVPMDNNLAERLLRGPAIGRRLSFGSDSEDGARFTAMMYSVVGTLKMNGIDILRWLEAWLTACARNGGRPPDDLSPWLPWSMSEERRRSFTATR